MYVAMNILRKIYWNRITPSPMPPTSKPGLEDQRLSELDIFSRVRLRLVNEEEPEPVKDLIAEVSERKRTKPSQWWNFDRRWTSSQTRLVPIQHFR